MDPVTLAFVTAGVLLIASEVFHLSLTTLFLGVGALVVAGLRAVGIVDGDSASLLWWGIATLALTLPLRPLVRKWIPAGDRNVDKSHEDDDAMGTVVDVLESVDELSSNGRIRFQGTSWAAQATRGMIAKGQKAKIVYRDKMMWVVEPIAALDEAHAVPALSPSTSSLIEDVKIENINVQNTNGKNVSREKS